jgi:hypothetical protein
MRFRVPIPPSGVLKKPTAQIDLDAPGTVATPFSSLIPPAFGLGLETTVHDVPSHRSASVRCEPLATCRVPTAQASVLLAAATPRSAWFRGNDGCGTAAQALPSKRRIELRYGDPAAALTTRPTAQTWLVSTPSAPWSSLLPGPFGLGTTDQVAELAAALVPAASDAAAANTSVDNHRTARRGAAAIPTMLVFTPTALKGCAPYEALTDYL